MGKPKKVIKIAVEFITTKAKKIQVEVIPQLQFEYLTDLRIFNNPSGTVQVSIMTIIGVTLALLLLLSWIITLIL